MTAAAQLDYALATDPFPLQASPATGNLVSCVLTILVSNPAADPAKQPVTIEGIEITLPIGGEPSELTLDATGVYAVPPGGWTPEGDMPAGVYAFVPPGGSIAVGAEPLVFVLAEVQVNREAGVVEGLTVQEGSGGCQPPDCPTVQLPLVKFPSGWGEVEFDVEPPDIKAGAVTSLKWSGPAAGPAGATYGLEWATSSGVVNVPGPGQPALAGTGTYPGPDDPALTPEETTTFTLTVAETVAGVPYSAQVQKTVTVRQAGPSIGLFKGEVAYDAAGDCKLTLHWATNADYCRLGGGMDELLPNTPPQGYTVTLAAPAPPTIELVAVRKVESGVQTASSTLTLGWGLASQLAIANPGQNRVIPALSPDGARLYVAAAQSLDVFEVPPSPSTVPPTLSTAQPQWPTSPDQISFLDIAAAPAGHPDEISALVSDPQAIMPVILFAIGCDASGKLTPGNVPYAADGFVSFCRVATTPPNVTYQTWQEGKAVASWAVDDSGDVEPIDSTQLESAIAVAAAADGTVYVATQAGSVRAYATDSGHTLTKITAEYPVAPGATIQDLDLAAGLLWVARGDAVLVLDPANQMKPVHEPIPVTADAIAAAADGMRLYAANTGTPAVEVLALTKLTGGVPG
jgi:hypothetical protein